MSTTELGALAAPRYIPARDEWIARAQGRQFYSGKGGTAADAERKRAAYLAQRSQSAPDDGLPLPEPPEDADVLAADWLDSHLEPPEGVDPAVPYPTTHRGGNGTERSAFTPDGSVPDRTGNDPERYGTDQPPLWFDVAGMLDNGIPEPPRPTICRRSDGVGLFYPGQVCNLFGDPESGKTWLGLAAVTETLAEEEPAAVLDLDHNGPEQTINRLLQLGADPQTIRDPELFRYVEPEDKAHLLAVVHDACQWHPVFVLLDSVGELLPTLGLNSANPDDYTQANTAVMKPLARAGACVVTLDHLAKNSESRAMGATGTTAKKRAIGGTSLRVAVHEPFTPGRGGSAYLTINKDRPGGLREFCPQEKGEPYAGLFQLTEDVDGMHWAVITPADAPSAPPVSEGLGSKGGMTEDEALAKLRDLPEEQRPKTNEDARKLLGCRNAVASAAMRELRSHPGMSTVPDTHPYMGNGTERSSSVVSEESDLFTPEPGTGTGTPECADPCPDCGNSLTGRTGSNACRWRHTQARKDAQGSTS